MSTDLTLLMLYLFIALFFSLLGDMYYLAADYTKSTNCYMKALSYSKTDITNWIGLMYSLRADGKIDIFEDLIFNFSKVGILWKKDNEIELNQDKLLELLKRVDK